MPDITRKQKVTESIGKLPQDASFDNIMECSYIIHKIEVRLEQWVRGDVISPDEVLK